MSRTMMTALACAALFGLGAFFTALEARRAASGARRSPFAPGPFGGVIPAAIAVAGALAAGAASALIGAVYGWRLARSP